MTTKTRGAEKKASFSRQILHFFAPPRRSAHIGAQVFGQAYFCLIFARNYAPRGGGRGSQRGEEQGGGKRRQERRRRREAGRLG